MDIDDEHRDDNPSPAVERYAYSDTQSIVVVSGVGPPYRKVFRMARESIPTHVIVVVSNDADFKTARGHYPSATLILETNFTSFRHALDSARVVLRENETNVSIHIFVTSKIPLLYTVEPFEALQEVISQDVQYIKEWQASHPSVMVNLAFTSEFVRIVSPTCPTTCVSAHSWMRTNDTPELNIKEWGNIVFPLTRFSMKHNHPRISRVAGELGYTYEPSIFAHLSKRLRA